MLRGGGPHVWGRVGGNFLCKGDQMNRRGFLTALCAALAAPPDPDKLLWTPGARLISIPKKIKRCKITTYYRYPVGPYWIQTESMPESLVPAKIEEIKKNFASFAINKIDPNPQEFVVREWTGPDSLDFPSYGTFYTIVGGIDYQKIPTRKGRRLLL